MPLLEAVGIGKSFLLNGRGTPILEDISFSVEPGETVVIVGQSGCGKSTLLRVLSGLELPDTGSVRLLGALVRSPTREISILFQRYTVFPWMTVRGNVEAGLLDNGVSRAARREIADAHLRMVGLLEYADERPIVLSGGMQQRLALARTYAMNPQVLLMDEPFGALDALTRGEMQAELARMNREHRKAIVFVTHDIHEAILLADRICVLAGRPARFVAEFRPDRCADVDVLYGSIARSLANQRQDSRPVP